MLASGAIDFTGGGAIVGERGPELVTIPEGANVFPTKETEKIIDRTKEVRGDNSGLEKKIDVLIETMNKANAFLENIYRKDTDVYLDGTKVSKGILKTFEESTV